MLLLVFQLEAITVRSPFVSISNIISIWGSPHLDGEMPVRKVPNTLFSKIVVHSPWRIIIIIVPVGCAVLKISNAILGIAVYLGTITFITFPRVSIPRVKGVTSISILDNSLLQMVTCDVVTSATNSSGFYVSKKSFLIISLTNCLVAGRRVDPPTIINTFSGINALASVKASPLLMLLIRRVIFFSSFRVNRGLLKRKSTRKHIRLKIFLHLTSSSVRVSIIRKRLIEGTRNGWLTKISSCVESF